MRNATIAATTAGERGTPSATGLSRAGAYGASCCAIASLQASSSRYRSLRGLGSDLPAEGRRRQPGVIGAGLTAAGAVGWACSAAVGAVGDRIGAQRLLVYLHLVRTATFAAYALLVHDAVSFILLSTIILAADQAAPAVTQSVVADIAEARDDRAGRAGGAAAQARGERVFVIVVPFVGPRFPRYAETIGLFTNRLVVRLDLTAASLFGDVVRVVREALIDAFDRADTPGHLVTEDLHEQGRELSLQVTFQVFPADLTERDRQDGLSISLTDFRSAARSFDLQLLLTEPGEQGITG